MAQFTPYQDAPKDPYYSNLSKEGDPAKTTSMLANVIKGVGDLGELAVKATDQVIKRAWQEDLTDPILKEKKQEQEDYWKLVNNAANPVTPTPAQQPQGGATTIQPGLLQGGSDPTQNPTQEPPKPVTMAMREQEKLTQAFNMGHLGDAGYNARMQSIIQGVASRYPGYADQIRTFGAHLVGHDPADALRGALQQTLDKLLPGNAEQSKWTNEVMLHYAPVFDANKDNPDTIKRMLAAATPAEQNMWRDWAGKRIASLHQTKNAITEYQLKEAQGKATSEDAQKTYSDAASRLVSNIFNGMDHNGEAIKFKAGDTEMNVPAALKEAQRMQQTIEVGGPQSEALRAKVGAVLGQAKVLAELHLNNMARQSGVARNMKPNELDALDKQALAPFDTIGKQVGAGYMTSATMNATLLSNAQNNAALQVIQIPYFRMIAGVSEVAKAGANQVLSVVNTSDTWKGQTRAVQSLLQMQMHEMLLPPDPNAPAGTGIGGKVTLADSIDRYAVVSGAEGGAKTPPPEYLYAQAKALRAALINPDVPLSTKVEAAKALSDPSNARFLGILKPGQKITAYQMLYDIPITTYMKGQGQDVWNQYRTTGALLFRQSMNTYLDTFKTAVSNGILYDVKWDNQSQQITFQTRDKQPGTNLSYGDAIVDPAVQAIHKINTALGTYNNILKEDKKTMSSEELSKLGVSLVPRGSDKSFNDVIRVLRTIPSEGEPTKAPGGRQKKSDTNSTAEGKITVGSNDINPDNIVTKDNKQYVFHNNQWYTIS